MTAPVCRCGHSAKEHAHGVGACWGGERRNLRKACPCERLSVVPVVVKRGTSDRCVRCGVTHALPATDLPWCPVDGRKATDAR